MNIFLLLVVLCYSGVPEARAADVNNWFDFNNILELLRISLNSLQPVIAPPPPPPPRPPQPVPVPPPGSGPCPECPRCPPPTCPPCPPPICPPIQSCPFPAPCPLIEPCPPCFRPPRPLPPYPCPPEPQVLCRIGFSPVTIYVNGCPKTKCVYCPKCKCSCPLGEPINAQTIIDPEGCCISVCKCPYPIQPLPISGEIPY